MKEARGDLFQSKAHAICITTNGYVKANGQCVMGRGCAKQISTWIPEIPKKLGSLITTNGNVVQSIGTAVFYGTWTDIVAYPVKPVTGTKLVNHMKGKLTEPYMGWACVAEPELIVKSAHELVDLADQYGWTDVALPRPGCGAGELDWNDIKPLLVPILNDRFTTYTY